MEQAESSSDSPRVFTREKWFVQLGMAARGIACCSKCGTSGRIVIQVPAFKPPACSRVTGYSEVMDFSVEHGYSYLRILRRRPIDIEMLTAIKLLHTLIWAFLAASIVALPVLGVLHRFRWA